MSGAASAVTLAVGITIILGFIGTVATVVYRIARRIESATGPDDEGHTLRDRVRNLEKLVINGIRADVQKVQTNQTGIIKTQAELKRELQTQAAHVDVYTKVAITDIADIWSTLNEAGLDRRGRRRTSDGGVADE